MTSRTERSAVELDELDWVVCDWWSRFPSKNRAPQHYYHGALILAIHIHRYDLAGELAFLREILDTREKLENET